MENDSPCFFVWFDSAPWSLLALIILTFPWRVSCCQSLCSAFMSGSSQKCCFDFWLLSQRIKSVMMLTLASILSSHSWRWSLHLNYLFDSKKWSLRKNLAMTRSALCHVHVTARMIMCLYGSKWWGISSVWLLSRAVSACDQCWHSFWIVHCSPNKLQRWFLRLLAIGEYCEVV